MRFIEKITTITVFLNHESGFCVYEEEAMAYPCGKELG
jgi:hypothetical protein